jgi:hypothetical protein
MFCLVASHALWSEDLYQGRVISAQNKAHVQLQANLKSVNQLVNSYESFVTSPTNVIGGSETGSAGNDGDNAKIILDALPNEYDFPALTTSIQGILNNLNLTVTSITGTDDEVNQASNTGSNSPQPVPIPFSFSISNASYASIQQLFTNLQLSIRPIAIDTVTLSGSSSNLTATIDAHTYYQPGIKLTTTTKVVK